MVQAIARALNKNHIPLRIDIGPQIKKYLTRVVNIHVLIHCHDNFCKHHLTRPPKPVHQFKGLVRILLL